MHLKTHAVRLLIVCVAVLVLLYEPGLAVFAVGGGMAALLIVGGARPTSPGVASVSSPLQPRDKAGL